MGSISDVVAAPMKPPLTGKTLGKRIDQAWQLAGIATKSEFQRRLQAAAAAAGQTEGKSLALSTITTWINDEKSPGYESLRLIRTVTGYGLDELAGPDQPRTVSEDDAAGLDAQVAQVAEAIGAGGRVGPVTFEDEQDIRSELPGLAALHGTEELIRLMEVELVKARQRRNGIAPRDASPGQTRARAAHAGDLADTLERSRASKNRKRLEPKKSKR